MVNHLQNLVAYLERIIDLKEGDVVVDIGIIDATALKSYKKKGSVE